jgi:hypothetical protein
MEERDGNFRDKLEERADDVREYVERNSPRPSVDGDVVDRLLDEAPPATAAAEIDKMVGGFQSGAGAATGRRNEPATDDAPIDDLTAEQPDR